MWHMDLKIKDNPVHSRQHGFRSDRSTDTAISELIDHVEMHVLKKKYCLGVFLDIRGAFDNIKPECVHQSLLKLGADKDMAEWYLAFLKHRNVTFELNGCSVRRSIAIGFPQGGVASAKFFAPCFQRSGRNHQFGRDSQYGLCRRLCGPIRRV